MTWLSKVRGKKRPNDRKSQSAKTAGIDNVYLKDVDISYVLLIYTYRKRARNFGVSVLNVKFDSKFKRAARLQFVPLVAKNKKKGLLEVSLAALNGAWINERFQLINTEND